MRRHFSGVALLALVLLLAVRAGAGNERAKAVRPWTTQSTFDVTRKVLPVPFEGNTIEWVVQYGTVTPKSEFETSAAYDARRQWYRPETYAFVLDEQPAVYDRATETLTVRMYPVLVLVRGAQSLVTGFNIRRTKLPPSSRSGPDRSSRTIRPGVFDRSPVTSIKRTSIQTQITLAASAESFPDAYEPLVLKVTLSAERAKRAQSNLQVAFVCIPAEEQHPRIGDTSVPEATGREEDQNRRGDFADETIRYSVALRAHLIQVWLFDRTTGEVFARHTRP
jgi:hypothetical protein